MTKLLAIGAFIGAVFFAHASLAPETPPIIELTSANLVLIRGPITEGTIAKAQKNFYSAIASRGSENYDIFVVFDSPGGSVMAGLAFYETIVGYKNVHSIVLRGYSMGAILPQLMPGKRYALQTSTLLFHPMKATNPIPSTTEQIKKDLEFTEQLESFIESAIVKRSKVSLEFYKKNAANDWLLLAPVALEHGFIDQLVIVRCSMELSAKTTTEYIQPIPFLPPMPIKVSACPLQL